MNLLPLLNDPSLARRLNERAAIHQNAIDDRKLLDAERREIERERQRQRNEARKAKAAMLNGEDDLIQ